LVLVENMKFPELKKKVKSFFLDEEGNISKSSLLKIGAISVFISAFLSEGAEARASCKWHGSGFCTPDSSVSMNAIPELEFTDNEIHWSHDRWDSHDNCNGHANGTKSVTLNPASHGNKISIFTENTQIKAQHEHSISTTRCNLHCNSDWDTLGDHDCESCTMDQRCEGEFSLSDD